MNKFIKCVALTCFLIDFFDVTYGTPRRGAAAIKSFCFRSNRSGSKMHLKVWCWRALHILVFFFRMFSFACAWPRASIWFKSQHCECLWTSGHSGELYSARRRSTFSLNEFVSRFRGTFSSLCVWFAYHWNNCLCSGWGFFFCFLFFFFFSLVAYA